MKGEPILTLAVVTIAFGVAVFPANPVHSAEAAILTVNSNGQGDKTSVQEAIDAGVPGTVVRISPGVYEERIVIDKPVTLEGDGWEKTTIMTKSVAAEKFNMALMKFSVQIGNRLKEAKTPDQRAAILEEFSSEYGQEHALVLVTNTDGVVLRGLKLTFPGKIIEGRILPVPIIKFSNAGAKVTDCAIIGSTGHGVEIAGDSDVEICKCLVAAAWSNGVVVSAEKSSPKARILDCDVRNCYHYGIAIRPGCDSMLVQGCRISGSAWHGIRYDHASPTIIGNSIWGNARAGIYTSGRTAATTSQNIFYKNEGSAISCWGQSADKIENNTFVSNYREAIAIQGGSKPTIRKNIFFSNAVAIALSSSIGLDAATLEGNLYWQNGTLEKVRGSGSETKAGKQKSVEVPASDPAGLAVDPMFVEPVKEYFSLAADSPARKAGIGAPDPISFQSPWALQPEEKAIIPDGDTRNSRQWKQPLLDKGNRRPQHGSPNARVEAGKAGTSWENKDFGQLLKEYRTLAAELDRELTAYRASLPVFAKFLDVCAKEGPSLNRAMEEAGVRLAEARKRGVDLQSLGYDKKASEEIIKKILAGKFKEIYAEFQKEMEAGNLSLTDEQQKVYYQVGYFHTQTSEPLSGRWEEHIPYQQDTPEYYLFVRDLAMASTMILSPLARMVEHVPQASRAKQQEVDRLYARLVQLKRQEKSNVVLDPRYEESYLKKLKASAGKTTP